MHIAEPGVLSTKQASKLRFARGLRTSKEVTFIRFAELEKLAGRQAITLDFGPGKRLVSTLDTVISHGPGAFTWSGRLPDGISDVSLTVQDDEVAGSIRTLQYVYAVHPLGNGVHALIQVDGSQFDLCMTVGSSLDGTEAAALTGANLIASDASATSTTTPDPVIDLMVLYTPGAAALGNIDALINNAITNTNTGLKFYSNVNVKVRLIHKAQVNYTPNHNDSLDVEVMYNPSDAELDEIHAWRDQYRADIVLLIKEIGGALRICQGRRSNCIQSLRRRQIRLREQRQSLLLA